MSKLEKFCQSREVEEASENAVDFAYCLGFNMRGPDNPTSSTLVRHLPFALVPSPVPRHIFQQAMDVMNDLNKLIHGVAADVNFMEKSLQTLFAVDDFTKKLFEIYRNTLKNNGQKYQMALTRPDYMFDCSHCSEGKLKQVEINMIASGLGGSGGKIAHLHRNVLQKYKLLHGLNLPKNTALTDIANAMIHAWHAYGVDNAVIMFLITDSELNIFDQRHIENEVFALSDIKVVRATLLDVFMHGKLGVNNQLIIKEEEVAVIYYRAGYCPTHYATEKEWSARQMMDVSNAINCPSAGLQLVGLKKMQQILAQDGVVEQFISDPDAVKRIRDTFVGLYDLDMNAQGDETVKMALNNPEKYVLKPQLEGGGNNFYGDDIVAKLSEIGHDKRRCQFILMDKMKPMKYRSAFVSNTNAREVEAVSELGVFSYILSKGKELAESRTCGHLLRSKGSQHNDGGLMLGVSVVDSVVLT